MIVQNVIKITVLIMFAVLFGACIRSESVNNKNGIKIITSNFPLYDFARVITGGKAEVAMLLPPGVDSQYFNPTPRNIINFQHNDVFFHIGGGCDSWVDLMLRTVDNNNIRIITLTDCLLGAGADLGSDIHVWTSPRYAKLIVQIIADVLIEIDEANSEFYKTNAAEYIAKLDELDIALQKVSENAVRHTLIFGDRFPFHYLTEHYGFIHYSAFPGCTTDIEPSPATIAFLINKVRTENIPLVLQNEMPSGNFAQTIANEASVKTLILHSCHNISRDEFLNNVTYLDLMMRNIEVLKEALW